ncbi:hypothetical protein NPIL_169771 [Nephila pilipes]|uniref:Uncharacterized protein n=1 Tax=Nephila pilipes TaxID=299642 RepID=A0A8X6ILM8_NEPPI|nr:hypothetical protein NPIL_169771 [Nephila pilipes]
MTEVKLYAFDLVIKSTAKTRCAFYKLTDRVSNLSVTLGQLISSGVQNHRVKVARKLQLPKWRGEGPRGAPQPTPSSPKRPVCKLGQRPTREARGLIGAKELKVPWRTIV